MPRFATLQFKARSSKAESLRAIGQLLRDVRADLIVLPEMCATGYAIRSFEHARSLAEAPDGSMGTAFSKVAASTGAWLVAGFPELSGDRVYNAASIHDPTGALRGVYRKTLLFEADEHWATPGDSGYPIFETDFGRLGVGICMDMNDDRFLAHTAHERVDVLGFPTNWVQEEGSVHDYWRYRLHMGWPEGLDIEHARPSRKPVDALLVAANSYGPEGDWVLRGESAILTRFGVLASSAPQGDALLQLDLHRR